MPDPITITIIQKPNGRIEPQEDGVITRGIRTKVPSGTPIQFAPGGSATDVAVFFDTDSPFGDQAADKHDLRSGTIRKHFDPANPGKNVYTYRCVLTIGGQQVSWPPAGQPGQGGEMEVIPGL